MYRGRYPQDVWEHRDDLPAVEDGDMEIIATRPDYLGVNYYTRYVNRPCRWGDKLGYETVPTAELGTPRNSMGWEVYPEGLYELLTRVKADYDDPVIYVTENGFAGEDVLAPNGGIHDERRIDYLQKHLKQAVRALAAGIKLKGYFVWTLIDNFEWEDGWRPRFGLVYLDHKTLRRTVKDSGWWYRDFISCQAQQNETINE
jgi:beta-glucosidase